LFYECNSICNSLLCSSADTLNTYTTIIFCPNFQSSNPPCSPCGTDGCILETGAVQLSLYVYACHGCIFPVGQDASPADSRPAGPCDYRWPSCRSRKFSELQSGPCSHQFPRYSVQSVDLGAPHRVFAVLVHAFGGRYMSFSHGQDPTKDMGRCSLSLPISGKNTCRFRIDTDFFFNIYNST
jgi:hypothetical protein